MKIFFKKNVNMVDNELMINTYWPIIYITRPNSDFFIDDSLQLDKLQDVIIDQIFTKDHFDDDKRDQFYREKVEITISLDSGTLEECTKLCETKLHIILDYLNQKIKMKYRGISLKEYLISYNSYIDPFKLNVSQFDIYITLYTKYDHPVPIFTSKRECFIKYKSWRMTDNLEKIDSHPIISWDVQPVFDLQRQRSPTSSQRRRPQIVTKHSMPIKIPYNDESSDSELLLAKSKYPTTLSHKTVYPVETAGRSFGEYSNLYDDLYTDYTEPFNCESIPAIFREFDY